MKTLMLSMVFFSLEAGFEWKVSPVIVDSSRIRMVATDVDRFVFDTTKGVSRQVKTRELSVRKFFLDGKLLGIVSSEGEVTVYKVGDWYSLQVSDPDPGRRWVADSLE